MTMVTALATADRRGCRTTLGMTGEVTLQGKVLPIGGVKQKVLAAHRGRAHRSDPPARNEADLDDVPEEVRAEMAFHPVDEVGLVIELALEPAAESVLLPADETQPTAA